MSEWTARRSEGRREGRAGGRAESGGMAAKKLEPHTEMWGIIARVEAYLTENCPPTFHFRGRSSVEAVLKGWLKGGLQGLPPCSKNKEFVLMLHGNLRCLRQEPLKRKVAVTLPEFLILL